MPTLKENEETGCCKRFDPKPWNEKEISFDNKLFVKDHVTSFFHVPLNFGKVMKRAMEKIDKVNAEATETLTLSDENSLWGSDIYIAVNKEVPGANTVRLNGKFLCKVYEGSYGETGKWIKEMDKFVGEKGKKMKHLYFFYTTCPACAKAYGENYTVLLAEI